jgi:hypothetical protein
MNEKLNLENLKIGDEITTITPYKNGFKYGWVYVTTEWCDRHKRWRYSYQNNSKKCAGWFPLTGHGYYFMSKRNTPDFYYSANPKHIEKAKAFDKKSRINAEKAATEQNRKMELAIPIGDLLKTEYYDSEECYHLDTTIDITEELVKRLTDDQIITLKGWLGV